MGLSFCFHNESNISFGMQREIKTQIFYILKSQSIIQYIELEILGPTRTPVFLRSGVRHSRAMFGCGRLPLHPEFSV